MDRLLVVDDVLGGSEADRPAFAHEDDAPHFRVASMRVRRAPAFAEQSKARSTPWPPVVARTAATLSGPAGSTSSKRQGAREGEPLGEDVDPDEALYAIGLASIAVASPTGPRPVTSTASLPLTPTRSRPSYTVPKPRATCAPSET